MTKNPIHTKLCDMLDIEYPIILAGMGGYAGPTLAAAVSNAGGLGVMGCTGFPIDTLVDMIRKTRSLTSKPFGVDILMPLPVGDLGSESAMKIELPAKQVEFVNQLKREFGVPEPEQSRSADFFNVEHAKREIEICIEERVPVFVSGLGNPASIVPQAHAQGMKVLCRYRLTF